MFSKVMRASWLMAAAALVLPSLSCQTGGELTGQVFIVTQARGNVMLGLVDVRVFDATEIEAHAKRRLDMAASGIEGMKTAYLKAKKERAESDKIRDQLLRPDLRGRQYMSDKRDYSILNLPFEQRRSSVRGGELYVDVRDPRWNKAFHDFLVADSEDMRKAKALEEVTPKIAVYASGKFFLHDLPRSLDATRTDADGRFRLPTLARKARYALAASATRKVADANEEYYWLVWVSLQGKPTTEVLLSNDNMLSVAGCPDCVLNLPKLPE